MRISLRQLELMVLTAKHQSVSAAAKEASLSQAAASMSLSQLEFLLGQNLFDREGKKLVINNLGKQILPQAHDIIQRVKELEQFVMKPGHISGHIHIGASTTIANYILPNIIHSFTQKHPDITIQLTAFNTENCIRELASFKIDIALVEGRYLQPNIKFTPWTADQLQIFCHPKHPLTKKTVIKPKDLEQYPWILREQESGTRQMLDYVLQQHKITLNDISIINSSEAIKNIIKHHSLALGCISEAILFDDIKAKKLVSLSIKDWKLERQFYQAHHRAKTNTHATRLFEEFLELQKI